ncbi:hypothetical protein KKB99_05850 [bacterium]|nr:hypothetical protein [bacterium]MBU1025514.1 hypothetical protein [bacterium]
MRTFLSVTTLIILAFIIFTGCSRGQSPLTPDTLPSEQIANARLADVEGKGLALWQYHVSIDADSLDYGMEPVRQRQADKIGDSFEVEISNFMTGWFEGIECQDCLRIESIGLFGNDDILLDVSMQHPLDSAYRQTVRADLDVFDPRLILIVNGTDSRFTLTDGIGISDDPIVGNFDFMKNADGYTSHFDNRAEIPEYIGTPRNYGGNLNPFKYFFVDIDSSPVVYGKENPNHRMRMSNNSDVQRLRLKNPGAGGTLEFEMVVEVSYVQSATMHTRLSPIYHIPEGNQKEAYRVFTSLPRSIVEGDATPLNFEVYVEDWQNDTPTGPLKDQVRAQSDVVGVTVEIPGVSSALGSSTIPVSGLGILYYPYDYNITMPVDLTPVAAGNPYLALIAVEDELNNTLRADPYYNPEPLDDFVAYVTLPIIIIPPGTTPLITIYNYYVNQSLGTMIISGEIQYLDQTSTVTLTHNGYSYPLNVAFDGTFTTTVVLFNGLNNVSIDATNTFGADNATLPPTNYSPNPLPKFRVTLYWWPAVPDPLDSTDMDLHMWNPVDDHCYYDNRSINNVRLTIDDPDGYGPENADGNGVLTTSARYPVAVNYYSNHRGFLTHDINFKVRFLLNPGTVDEITEEWPSVGSYLLTMENLNNYSDYPILTDTNSWIRVRDIWVDASGVASTIAPDITHPLPL